MLNYLIQPPARVAALLVHAMHRYGHGRRKMPPELAVECLLSDRRTAGLGALDEEKRGYGFTSQRPRNPSEVIRYKWQDRMSGVIVYKVALHREQRWELPPDDPDNFFPGMNDDVGDTVQLVEVKAEHSEHVFRIHPREVSTQRDRDQLAWRLREWRRLITRQRKAAP